MLPRLETRSGKSPPVLVVCILHVDLGRALYVLSQLVSRSGRKLLSRHLNDALTQLPQPAMASLPLIDRIITFSSADERDGNVLNQLGYVKEKEQLYQTLVDHREIISALVRHHLRLGRRDTCEVLPRENWIRGSFNVCIPVEVKSGSLCRKLMLRCPMPFKLAGIVDEKLSCEVATYAWMQDKCPDVRIPFLYGFGFTDHRHFTHEQQRPWYIRLVCMFRRALHHLNRRPDLLSHYSPNRAAPTLPSAYVLLEFIGPEIGLPLAHSWEAGRHEPQRRQRLFRCIARTMLSLARVPLPKVGSFQFSAADCTVTLTNRPLICGMAILENDGAPRTIHGTYSSTESYVSDMISLHDGHFLNNPNSVVSETDCRVQMANRTLLRTLGHHYIRPELRNGPFVLQFTDFHGSNVFIDEQWDITCLIDLEWLCALPAEMLHVPYWITGRSIDGIVEEDYDEFDKVRKEFMAEFEKEEKERKLLYCFSLASVMDKTWESKGVWFWHCLTSINALRFLLEAHICPAFSTPIFHEKIWSRFWREDSEEVVKKKVADYEQYKTQLRRAFGQQAEYKV